MEGWKKALLVAGAAGQVQCVFTNCWNFDEPEFEKAEPICQD